MDNYKLLSFCFFSDAKVQAIYTSFQQKLSFSGDYLATGHLMCDK